MYKLDVFFLQAEDGIRDRLVTGVQTCALPISVLKFDRFCRQTSQLAFSWISELKVLRTETISVDYFSRKLFSWKYFHKIFLRDRGTQRRTRLSIEPNEYQDFWAPETQKCAEVLIFDILLKKCVLSSKIWKLLNFHFFCQKSTFAFPFSIHL